MFPADFAYVRARTLDEALDLLDEAHADDQEAKLIAGGQSLLPLMKLRLAAPQVLIDIADLPGLSNGGWMRSGVGGFLGGSIGALSTYRQLGRNPLLNGGLIRGRNEYVAPDRAEGIPAVTDVLSVLADPQVRARGTIGGAVAHGDPASDLPAVLLALNAELTIASRKGRHPETQLGHLIRRRTGKAPSNIGKREITLDDFLQGIYTTDLADDEIITHVRISHQGGDGQCLREVPAPSQPPPAGGRRGRPHLQRRPVHRLGRSRH